MRLRSLYQIQICGYAHMLKYFNGKLWRDETFVEARVIIYGFGSIIKMIPNSI